jgi:hypothetical protein
MLLIFLIFALIPVNLVLFFLILGEAIANKERKLTTQKGLLWKIGHFILNVALIFSALLISYVGLDIVIASIVSYSIFQISFVLVVLYSKGKTADNQLDQTEF